MSEYCPYGHLFAPMAAQCLSIVGFVFSVVAIFGWNLNFQATEQEHEMASFNSIFTSSLAMIFGIMAAILLIFSAFEKIGVIGFICAGFLSCLSGLSQYRFLDQAAYVIFYRDILSDGNGGYRTRPVEDQLYKFPSDLYFSLGVMSVISLFATSLFCFVTAVKLFRSEVRDLRRSVADLAEQQEVVSLQLRQGDSAT